MTDMRAFTYENSEVRTIMIDGAPWWVLKDVCLALDIGNPSKVAERLDEDEKDIFKTNSDLVLNIPSRGLIIINESGLYSVILRSDKTKAKAFRHWITHKVLPSIRKHGLYAADDLLSDPDLLIAALQRLKAEKEKSAALQGAVDGQNQQIAEMTAKSSYFDLVLNTADAVSVTAIAKDFGKSAQWLNGLLHDCGIQYRQEDLWVLYQKYAGNGYTRRHFILAILKYREVLRVFFFQSFKHKIDGIFVIFVVFLCVGSVDHVEQADKVLFLVVSLVEDVADKRRVIKALGL